MRHSIVVQMNIATRTLVTEKLISKMKPSMILVDNVVPAADASLVFNDVFTPSITNAVPAPVLQTIPRLQINVASGTCVSVQDKLKDVEFLGLVQVVVNLGVALANCFVTFGYHDDEDDNEQEPIVS